MPSIQNTPSTPLLLALDTSSSLGSVALTRGKSLIGSRSFLADHGHSRNLLPAIDSLFVEASIPAQSVDLFAVVKGPGSFTGLRVSLACVRGLAAERPCFGALTTEVLAWAARGRGRRILALADLFHGEVFGAVHDDFGNLISTHEAGEVSGVLEALRASIQGSIVAVGAAALKHRDAVESAFPGVDFVETAEGLAPHLASLAGASGALEGFSPASEILPFYLRDPVTRGLLGTPPRIP